jgi:aminopeptidase N
MMRQLERLMGKDAFRDGLREYLSKYKFGNASWPELIKILDRHTTEDLPDWNKVWVNQPGRPVISYSLEQNEGTITKLVLQQKGEYASQFVLPQFFEIALVYNDTVEEYTVHLNKQQTVVEKLAGKPVPNYILFNSSGQGYGLFPVDENMFASVTELENPVMRAAAYINLYENMLSGKVITPAKLLALYQNVLSKEPEELNLRLLTNQVNDIYWKFSSPGKRLLISGGLEKVLWETMQSEVNSNRKKLLFKAYQSIALNRKALDTLYNTWSTQKPPTGVKLTEEDYTSLALSLAVKNYPVLDILQQQLVRIKNIDRKNRLQFLMPALSPDATIRNTFFKSLREEKNREKEAWVVTALEYLHHPLRASTSEKYLQQSLELLQEIQSTGDIFFPASWLQSTFGNYQTTEAANVVRNFLKTHPNYNLRLKAKILQAADNLFRASQLITEK